MYNTRKCAQSRSFLLIRFLPASLLFVIFVWKNRRENMAGVLENSASRISRLGRCDIRHDEDLPRGYHEYDDVMADSDNQLFISIPHVVKYCSSAVHPVSGPTHDPNQTRMLISTVHLQTVRSWDDYTRSSSSARSHARIQVSMSPSIIATMLFTHSRLWRGPKSIFTILSYFFFLENNTKPVMTGYEIR